MSAPKGRLARRITSVRGKLERKAAREGVSPSEICALFDDPRTAASIAQLLRIEDEPALTPKRNRHRRMKGADTLITNAELIIRRWIVTGAFGRGDLPERFAAFWENSLKRLG